MEGPKVMLEQLQKEVKRLKLQLMEWSVEQEFVQAKVQLEVPKAMESERRKWEDVEKNLLEQLTEAKRQSVISVPAVVTMDNGTVWRPNEPITAVENASRLTKISGINRGSPQITVSDVHSSNIDSRTMEGRSKESTTITKSYLKELWWK